MKRPGTEGGRGVSLAQDLDDLIAQLSNPNGSGAMLERFVPHDRCWRVTVLNGRVVCATASVAARGDFRTNAPGGHILDGVALPQLAAKIAIKAVAHLKLEFGGVDLMEGPDGSLTLAEVNFPCVFADQQEKLATDIAGAILDHLIMKAGACGTTPN